MKKSIVWVAILVVILVFYAWTSITSSSERLISKVPYGDYYSRMVPQFLQWKFHLPEVPEKRLIALKDPRDCAQRENIYFLWDASLYKGKYYIYWGVTPLLVSYIPFFYFTGYYLFESIWLCIYAFAGVYFAYKTILYLLSYLSRETTFSEKLGIFCICSFSSFYPFILRRPAVYEIAIGCAFCFTWMSCFFFMRAIHAAAYRKTNLAFSGLGWGLAIGARPTTAVLVFFFLALVIPDVLSLARRSAGVKETFSKIAHRLFYKKTEVTAFLIPLFFMVGFILYYNFVRFENPFEFGDRYQLTLCNAKDLSLNMKRVWNGILHFLFTPPRFSVLFPFVQVPCGTKASFLRYHPINQEPTLGFLYACPFMVFYLFMKGIVQNTKFFLLFLASLAMGFLVLGVQSNVGVTGRYVGDWSMFFIIPIVLLYFMNRDESYFRIHGDIVRWGFLCCFVFSMGINFLISFTGVESRLEKVHPGLFRTLRDTLRVPKRKPRILNLAEVKPEFIGGLKAKYYNGRDFNSLVLTRTDTAIDFDWGGGPPADSVHGDNFSVRWDGYIKIDEGGEYTFYSLSDDGVRMMLDGRTILENWTSHYPTENSKQIKLEPGWHRTTVEYNDTGGGAVIKLSWSSRSMPKAIVPSDHLSFYK